MRELVAPAPTPVAENPTTTPTTTTTVPVPSPRRRLRLVWTAPDENPSSSRLACRWRPEIYSLPFVR
jgi:hypothetical protein